MAFLKKTEVPRRFSSPKFLLASTVLLGFLLRLYQSWALALNNDEGFKVLLIRGSWANLFHGVGARGLAVYEVLLKLWTSLLSRHVFSLRLLSIMFGTLSIYAMYRLAKQVWKKENLALTAALFFALNPILIRQSLGVQESALAALLFLGAIYFSLAAWATKKPAAWSLAAASLISAVIVFLPDFRNAILPMLIASAATILLAWLVYRLPKFTTRRYAIGLVVLLELFWFAKNWNQLDLPHHPGLPAAAAFVNDNNSQDKIYLGSAAIIYSFDYYNQTSIVPHLYQDSAEKNTNVWVVWTNDGQTITKPNVPGNWSVVIEKNFTDTVDIRGDIVVTEYRVN